MKNDLAAAILDFIFPPLCLGCGEYTEDEEDICSSCRGKFELWDHPFCITCRQVLPTQKECPICLDKSLLLFSCSHYQEPVTEIIKQFKFKGITKTAGFFANLVEENFKERILDLKPDYLLPIPLAKERENIRGYNQADVFAHKLGQVLKLPVENSLLMRSKKRKPQSRLKMNERAGNIKDVFSISNDEAQSSRLILVDDVVTSGMTVLEAKKCLTKNNHDVLAVISIAQAF